MESAVVEKKPGLKQLFQYKSYMTLLTANIISRFGDSIDSVAYEWMVYVLTGSKLLMGALLAVNALPNILFSIFSGVIVDHYPKKKAVIIGYTGRGIIVCITASLYLTKLLQPWHLFVLTFLTSTLESFASPAERSLLPLFLPKDMFLSANSLTTSATTFSQLVGFAAAGIIISAFDISGAIFIDGLTFFAACFLIYLIKIKNDNPLKSPLTPGGYVQNLKEGFKFVKKDALILISLMLAALVNFCLAPLNVLMPAWIKDILKAGPEGLSMTGMGLMAGMVLGGLAAGQFGPRFKKSHLITAGIGSIGIGYALLSIPGNIAIPFVPPLALAVAVCFIIGFFVPVASSPLSAYTLTNTPPELLGRVSALMSMLCLCATPIGNSLTGVVSEYVSIPILFLSMGLLIVFASMLPLFNRKYRES